MYIDTVVSNLIFIHSKAVLLEIHITGNPKAPNCEVWVPST